MSTNVSWERIFVTGMRFARIMLVCTTALAWMDILEMALTVEVTLIIRIHLFVEMFVCLFVCLLFEEVGRSDIKLCKVRLSYCDLSQATPPSPPHFFQ